MLTRILITLLLIPTILEAHGMPPRNSFMDNFGPAGRPPLPRPNMPQRPAPQPPVTPIAASQAPVTVPPVFVPHQNAVYHGPPPKTVVGTLAFPENIFETPAFVAFYNGMRIDISNGTYQLNDPFATQQSLHVIFTLASVKPISAGEDDANTIAGLAFDAQAPYKSFMVKRNPAYSARATLAPAQQSKKEQKPWIISRTELGKKKGLVFIPDNAMIVLISPDSIATLDQELWSDEQGNMSRLPKIVLKSDLEQKTVMQLADHSALAAIDLDPFHRRPTIISEVKKELPALVVSMVAELPNEIHS